MQAFLKQDKVVGMPGPSRERYRSANKMCAFVRALWAPQARPSYDCHRPNPSSCLLRVNDSKSRIEHLFSGIPPIAASNEASWFRANYVTASPCFFPSGWDTFP
jgi:hypothetical protein